MYFHAISVIEDVYNSRYKASVIAVNQLSGFQTDKRVNIVSALRVSQ